MRLSLLLTCVVVVGMIGVSVFAQSDEELVPTPVDPFASKPDPVDAETEDQILRQQYLELIEQKSVHMDRSALREAISRAEKDIDELKADAKLQEAKQLLLDLVKSHPGTSAAQTARTMLQADPHTRSRTAPMMFGGPQPYSPDDENATYRPPSGEIMPPTTGFEQGAAPYYDPGIPQEPVVPVKPRPSKKGQSDEPFRSPFGSPAEDDESLDG